MSAERLLDHHRDSECLKQLLEYDAPFLIEKLLKEQIVADAEEGRELFREVKRYLVLNRIYPDHRLPMVSRRIDEVWHQFVLFTHEYASFCQQHVGRFLHHHPSNAPGSRTTETESSPRTIAEFRRHYESVFGEHLPDVWRDRASVHLHRRVVLAAPQESFRIEHSHPTVTLMFKGKPAFSVNAIAEPALEFIVQTRAFYVRELPGDLSEEEKVSIIDTLFGFGLVAIAP